MRALATSGDAIFLARACADIAPHDTAMPTADNTAAKAMSLEKKRLNQGSPTEILPALRASVTSG